jgi:penicillin-binding protein 2
VFKVRVRVLLILVFGGLLMVSTRLFYLQVVCGAFYGDYAENVRRATSLTEACRGTIYAAGGTDESGAWGGERLAFDEPAFNIAAVLDELPRWERMCRPVLRLYSLQRREKLLGVGNVKVEVTGDAAEGGYAVGFSLEATFLRQGGDGELATQEERGEARVVVPQETQKLIHAVAGVVERSAKEHLLPDAPAGGAAQLDARVREMLRELFEGLALVGRGWRPLDAPILVARDVDFLAAAEIESNADRYPGFRVVETARRSYPYDSLACHVLGYVHRVNAEELARWRESFAGLKAKRFLPDDLIGRQGLERSLEPELRAARGEQTLEVDAARRTQRILNEEPEAAGADVRLTLDCEVQRVAEAALEGQVGSIVLMEAKTGRILAMASAPGFNPNEVPRHPPDPDDPFAPLVNRAVRGLYPLGSAFKLVVAVGALEEGKAPASIPCSGMGKYLEHGCTNHPGMDVNLREAIKRSCNLYFYRTANERLGADGVAKWAMRFGLGRPTEVGLPWEKAGTVPTPEWKRRECKGEPWYAGETCDLAIGQGYLRVTPIQVARLVAAIANGGKLVRPRLVDKIVRAGGSVQERDAGDETLPVASENLRIVRDAMRAVCHEHGGTAHRTWSRSETQADWCDEWGYSVAGKTSTAECKIRGREGTIGWFVGFAPYEDPRIVFVVALEHERPLEGGRGVHGADVAAPLARRLLERLPERCLEGFAGRERRDRARARLAAKEAAP